MPIRTRSLALLLSLALAGCAKPVPTEVVETPDEVIAPRAVDEAPPPAESSTSTAEASKAEEPAVSDTEKAEESAQPAESPKSEESTPAEETPKAEEASPSAEAPPAEPPAAPAAEEAESKEAEPGAAPNACGPVEAEPEVKIEKLSFDQLKKAIATKKAKYTIVDCWASWCGPCKENFPHVLEMHEKFGSKGLNVISCSFDGGTGEPEFDDKELAAAQAFLEEKKSPITNVLLAEDRDQMFEKFDISTIPAVFVYDATGREVKRYTWDDPNNQFTYEQVEKEVAALLGVKP